MDEYKYFAFISYNSKDIEWGKKVQKKLEHFRMPATLCREQGWERTPIKPVFFAPTDIQPGGLTDELQERLRSSRNLIVICSPNSAKSDWVGKEIEYFHQLGRAKNIHFFIVDGQPHSMNPDVECLNPIINKIGLPEILGANINEKVYRWPWMNKERAYVQLVSKLLGVEFDAIWQRHKRLLIQRTIAWFTGIMVVLTTLFTIWLSSQPVDVEVRLNEISLHNDNLPPLRDALVTMILDNETKVDTIHSLSEGAFFWNIPHRFVNNAIHIRFECAHFIPVDTTVALSEIVSINIQRDSLYYGKILFRLWNAEMEQTSSDTEIIVGGYRVFSDADGYVSMYIPLEEQDTVYSISSSTVSLLDNIINTPCGQDDVLLFK